MNIEITIYDGAGNVVEHSIGPAQMATDAEIADIIALIEAGVPACLASQLVLMERE
jgi:hypothetical protein